MFNKILIANRGEIALRIIRTCKELGIKTVAIYSNADKNSLHISYADEKICIGPSSAKDSYLNISTILSTAKITNCDAIHPGYGFLAENSEFAAACLKNDITFIGPGPEIIDLMGNKSAAKETMIKAGIPVIPGSKTIISSLEESKELISEIGYPILLKASAGGGGKGMRIVNSSDELDRNFQLAKSEALSAFNDDSIYFEKFIKNPKHIEVQLLCDSHGNVLIFGERDCSIQRNHQKLIEETPSSISDELRKKIFDSANKAAKYSGYQNAGTIEYLVDSNGNYYFMEMNTRIQVEHPISEQVTSTDLIKMQIFAAAGENLSNYNIEKRGHSIEFRINAEDPANNFKPSPGEITKLILPLGRNVRIDTHIYQGYTIPSNYDSLLAKLIVWGNNREEALKTAKRALNEFVIDGVKTTIPFHLEVLENKNFQNGIYDTRFIDIFNN